MARLNPNGERVSVSSIKNRSRFAQRPQLPVCYGLLSLPPLWQPKRQNEGVTRTSPGAATVRHSPGNRAVREDRSIRAVRPGTTLRQLTRMFHEFRLDGAIGSRTRDRRVWRHPGEDLSRVRAHRSGRPKIPLSNSSTSADSLSEMLATENGDEILLALSAQLEDPELAKSMGGVRREWLAGVISDV